MWSCRFGSLWSCSPGNSGFFDRGSYARVSGAESRVQRSQSRCATWKAQSAASSIALLSCRPRVWRLRCVERRRRRRRRARQTTSRGRAEKRSRELQRSATTTTRLERAPPTSTAHDRHRQERALKRWHSTAARQNASAQFALPQHRITTQPAAMDRSPRRDKEVEQQLSEISKLMMNSPARAVAAAPPASAAPISPRPSSLAAFRRQPPPLISSPVRSTFGDSSAVNSPSARGPSASSAAAPAGSTFDRTSSLPIASFGASTEPLSPPRQQELVSQIVADRELQQSLRGLGESFEASKMQHQQQQQPASSRYYQSSYASDQASFASSLASSAAPSPLYGATPAPFHSQQQLTSQSLYTPAQTQQQASQFPSFAAPHSAAVAPLSSKHQLDGDLERHAQALASARQRLEAMGIRNLPSSYQQQQPQQQTSQQSSIYNPSTADASFNSSRAPSELSSAAAYQHPTAASRALAEAASAVAKAQHQRAEDADELTSSGEDEEEDAAHASPSKRATIRGPPRARSAARPKATGGGSLSVRPTTAKPAAARSLTGHVTARSGTFGTAVRPTSTSGPGAVKKPATARSPHGSPTRGTAGPTMHASPTKASSALVVHSSDPHDQALLAKPDDVSLLWADRYKTLLNRNMSLGKKNKELGLRNQALQSSIQQLTADVQQITAQKDEALHLAQATEEKLVACKAVLRSERDAAAFHNAKHLHSAESAHLSAINRLTAEHEAIVEDLKASLSESKKRNKTLQLVAHGVQGKLDAKTSEVEKLEQQIESLHASLATSVSHANAANIKAQKTEATLKQRDEELRSTYAKLSDTLTHAEKLAADLSAAQKDRADLLRSFRALQQWSDSLLSAEGKLAGGLGQLQREAERIREAGEQYALQLRALNERQPIPAPAGDFAAAAAQEERKEKEAAALEIAAAITPPPAPAAPPASSASQILPASTMLRQTLLQEDASPPAPRALRSPESALGEHRSAFTAPPARVQPQAHAVSATHQTASSQCLFDSADSTPRSFPPAPTLSTSATIAQLQERLRKLNLQSREL